MRRSGGLPDTQSATIKPGKQRGNFTNCHGASAVVGSDEDVARRHPRVRGTMVSTPE
jgi:hypothetical protein